MDPTLLKSVLIEQMLAFQVQEPTIAREASLALEKHIGNPQVLVVSGLRRSGKSVLLAQIWKKHYHDKAYFVTFEDERLLAFTAQDFNTLLECCISLFGEYKTFFLDEIQNIEHWEAFVRRLQERGYKFFITGSNAALLSGELASRLTGRNIQFELYPFSFREFLQFQKLLSNEENNTARQYSVRSSVEKAILSAAFETYLTQGGIPLYLKYQDPLLLKQIYDDILYKDIILRHRIDDPKTLRELSFYLLSNVAHTLTYTSVKNQLKLGSLNTVKNYLHYFESSYLFFFVSVYSSSVKQQQMSPKKIYAIDTGMVNLLSFKVSRNSGSLLENLVYIELRRRGGDIFYYQCVARQYEVDFLVRQGTSITALIQVCESLHHPATRERELRSLWMAMDELQLNHSLVLTRDYEEIITDGGRTIEIRPVYEWLI